MSIFERDFFGFNHPWFMPFGYQRGWNGFNTYMAGFPFLSNFQKGSNGFLNSNTILGGRKRDIQKGGNGIGVHNNLFAGAGADSLYGGSGLGVKNYLDSGSGPDYIKGGNGLGTKNIEVAKSGNDILVGGGFGTENIFKPGTGKNLVTTKAGSKNFVDLSTDDNRYGRNVVNGALGKTTVDISDYRGAKTVLNLNDDDVVLFNASRGINNNVKINGNPKLKALIA